VYKNSPTIYDLIQLTKVSEINDIWRSSNTSGNEFYRFTTGDVANVLQCSETLFQRRQALHIETFQERQPR
jgi:hypothetical protein